MGIQRFDWDEFSMLTDSEGDYVRFAHYEAEVASLRAELTAKSRDAERLHRAIGIVCEGFTLPDDVRKILEKAMWSDAAMGEGNGR